MKLLIIYIVILSIIFANCSKIKNENKSQTNTNLSHNECYQAFSATSTIFLAGLGDKSFLITTVMATKYNKNIVLISASTSLIIMGIISVQLGLTIPKFIPLYWIDIIAIVLFLLIGIKMLFDGISMNYNKMQEDTKIIGNTIIKEALKDSDASLSSIKQEEIAIEEVNKGYKETIVIFFQIFFLIFTAELGDKSQISTIYLSSNFQVSIIYFAVIVSQVLLTILAVFCGRIIMGKISESNLTIIAGCLFIMFGLLSLYLTYIHDYLIIKKALHKYLTNETNIVETIPDKKLLNNNFLKS